MIETRFDIPFVAGLALREKQIQQNYRPIIAVHKWFARRPGALFRALLLAEFGDCDLSESYYKSNALNGRKICDPFMGGGTPLLEANRTGCDVIGLDINPMAHWIVREEIEHINLPAYRHAANQLRRNLERQVGGLYRTRCLCCGRDGASVKYFLWVKTKDCSECGATVDLFPGYIVSEDARHPKNVFVCATCGELTECEERENPGLCFRCSARVVSDGPAKRGRCECPHCHASIRYPDPLVRPPNHRMFAIEYYCPRCKNSHRGRFFKRPDASDLERFARAETMLAATDVRFAPEDAIPSGDETDRLHKWGYRKYRDMFNARQLLGLELSAQWIAAHGEERIKHALATNLSDLLRYQNMLCRYDTMALKSLDIFSVHGFPVGLVQCESNLLGIAASGETSVGSGGWSNIIDKYAKAKAYCDDPFEIRFDGTRKLQVALPGEWIGEHRALLFDEPARLVDLRCADSADVELEPGSLDAVLTDPPYFGNVQYAELMDFCFVWLRRLAGDTAPNFERVTTRSAGELTGNDNMNRGICHFTEGLSQVFQKMAIAMRPAAPLAFTYHHNRLDAYQPIVVAILDAGLACTRTLPCPAEMGASIHINGTGSSTVDTVFVCRKPPLAAACADKIGGDSLTGAVASDRTELLRGGVKVTGGDERCILFGHISRAAISKLSPGWNRALTTELKLRLVREALADLARVEQSCVAFTGGTSLAANLQTAIG
ncbi:MAG: DUF1156 domain-containing protein [Bryobacteraceae bacterium]